MAKSGRPPKANSLLDAYPFLPDEIQAAREARNITVRDLANRAGISEKLVKDLESRRRRNIGEEPIFRLMRALNTTIPELQLRSKIRTAQEAASAAKEKFEGILGATIPQPHISILEIYQLHNSVETKRLRQVIRDGLAPYMRSFKKGEAPLADRKDDASKSLRDDVEALLNYYEMLGAIVRYRAANQPMLLDMVHNSCTALWDAITQTNEKDDIRRFDDKHIELQFDKIRAREKRGPDYASDVQYLALMSKKFRDARLHFAFDKPATGGTELQA